MKIGRRIGQLLLGGLLVLLLSWSLTACVQIGSKVEPLAAVSTLPNPKLPDWIEQISPTGEAKNQAQIRIRFQEPLISVESLDSADQQSLLKKFELLPPLPGRFRFLTPRMVGFQADQAIPKATRVQVTLKAGLADLKQHRLGRDLSWTFNTEPIKLIHLPGKTENNEVSPEPIALKPALEFASNLELDLNSVKQHLALVPLGQSESIPIQVEPVKPEEKSSSQEDEEPEEKFDPALKTWRYKITPEKDLDKATVYQVKFAPGLKPARGNLPSDKAFTSQVKTYEPLKLERLELIGKTDAGGTYGRFVKGAPQLVFNNQLNLESALKSITVQPLPTQEPQPIQAYEDDSTVRINPWSLKPATTYTITIDGNLKDKYGQTLGKTRTLKYQSGDVGPEIWVSEGRHIFPLGKDLQLHISTVNLPESQYKAAYQVVQPTDLVYLDSATPPEEQPGLLPEPESWKTFRTWGTKNQSVENTVPLREQLGAPTGMLAYGVQARTNRYLEDGKTRWREPTLYGMVQVTNLGVFAQWFPDSGFVRVHHLSDGSAVANAEVQIYESRLDAKARPEPQVCATGKTDRTGTLTLTRTSLQRCMRGDRFGEAPKLLTIVREGKDWSFVRTTEYSGVYNYDVNAGWQGNKPEAKGTIFSDRQLYQPGEKAYFTGVATYLQNGILQQDKNSRYTVTIKSSDGKELPLGTYTTNAFGTFSAEFSIPTDQSLGDYTIQAKGGRIPELLGEFRVAEFKPPNFKVDLALNQTFAVPEQKIEAKTNSQYLFGAPVQGGKARYYVTRRQKNFVPQGWDQFSFGRQWYWPERAPTVSSEVLQAEQTLDAQGQNTQLVPVLKDLPYPMEYRVDVEVSDVSNLSVSDSRSLTVLPGDRLIGLQSDFIATAGKAFPIQIVVTDPKGQAISGQRVRVELQQMKYSSVTRVVEGSRTPKNQLEFQTVVQAEMSSGTTPQTVTLIPPQAGSYRIRANWVNAKGEATASDRQIWVTGQSSVAWGEHQQLPIKLDKERYQPGEMATALIQSPYPEAELYLAVVRHGVLYQTITKVKGGAPQVQFQVTPEMLPNAAVEAVLVRQGVPLEQAEGLENLVQVGMVPLQINLDSRYLKVQVSPTQPSLLPGGEQTLQLKLQDLQNRPLQQGQLTVMVVNDAILQLNRYRAPDLVKLVYAEQGISTRFADNRPEVVLRPLTSPLDKGWGYGGGFSSATAGTRVRRNFQPIAYYNGSVLTDAQGLAKVSFKLPDDLTTWRVMVVAASQDLRFGQTETTFVTTQPLLANPLLPQFARPGDRLEAGVAITNTTGQSGNLTINSTAIGAVRWADNRASNFQGQVQAGTQAYRFPLAVNAAGTGQLQFKLQLNNVTDAFEVSLPVKPLEVNEQVVETGATPNRAEIPFQISQQVVPEVGGLALTLSSNLIPQLTAPAQAVLEEAELPFLETAASRLAIAANLQILGQKYRQTFADFKANQQATSALETLQKLQQPDGGFASWPGQKRSDPFVSAYAAESLAQGIAAGFSVNPDRLSRLQAYLSKLLADPGQYDFCKQSLCKNQVRLATLRALAELSDRRNEFLPDLYQQRQKLDPLSQIQLARYLLQFPDWQTEAQQMAEQLQESVYETGRSATANFPQRWRWLGSSTRIQAELLRLAIAQKRSPEVLGRLVQGLLNQRRQGVWSGTYNNAVALNALVNYSQVEPVPPNFTASIRLGNRELGSTRFQGYQNTSFNLQVPMAQLPQGQQTLRLQKSGEGTLHYQMSYRYRLQGNPPGRLNGLRVRREIRQANQEKLLQQLGLYAPDQPLKLPLGQVFDIGLEITTDHPVDHVLITDPLPAGLEAVDSQFQTTPPYFQAQRDSWQIGYQTIYRDRVVAYGEHLEPGVYTLHYLVRSVTPGTFLWPGSEAHLQYAPEEFGRTAAHRLVLSP